jgi:hypothetical protein
VDQERAHSDERDADQNGLGRDCKILRDNASPPGPILGSHPISFTDRRSLYPYRW